MTHPTDPVAAMREVCAKTAEGLAGENSYKAMVCDEIAAAIRALPVPEPPLVIDDPFTEAQRRQLEEALHFQNALVDLLGEPTEKLEPWALAKIKAMQDALAATSLRPDDEIRAVREACAKVADELTNALPYGPPEDGNHFRVWHGRKIADAIRAIPIPAAHPSTRRPDDEIRAVREACAAATFDYIFNCVCYEGGKMPDPHEAQALVLAVPIPAASPDPRDDALRLAKLAIDGAEPWVESGPAGAWRDEVLQRITTARAAVEILAALVADLRKVGEGK